MKPWVEDFVVSAISELLRSMDTFWAMFRFRQLDVPTAPLPNRGNKVALLRLR